jgi:peptidoglycan/xylan/chitin deacetylase (PgdA/CDA1 family)
MVSKTEFDYPHPNRVYLTLDFECDYGTALSANYYNAVQHASQLIDLLESHDVPVSCFLQTEILDTCPETVEPFLSTDVPVDFHAHSHTHPPRESADIAYEVAESIRRVRDEFETESVGFRFPDGAAKPSDYEVLAEHDVQFSSSVFPSWRPGRFNNLRGPRRPYEVPDLQVLELPFTVYGTFVRIPVSLSYLKLFGAAYERLLSATPPKTIVFDFHMHDLIVPPSYKELPLPYRVVYSRRKHNGFELLERFIRRLQEKGYTFGLMTDLFTEVLDDAR